MSTGSQLAPQPIDDALPNGRSPLAHLLHALNQPLTGLQCSLELAVAGPRRTEHYIQTLRDGLELTGRMRVLVEAIRELADEPVCDEATPILLNVMVRDTADDLLPVADAKGIRIVFSSDAPLPVRTVRGRAATLLFRLLESALGLAREGTDLNIVAKSEAGNACLVVAWTPGPPPEHSPFSRQELGLLLAQAGWEQAGAKWTATRSENSQTCTIRLPLAVPLPDCDSPELEIPR